MHYANGAVALSQSNARTARASERRRVASLAPKE